MYGTILVFLVGTVLSFSALLWLLLKPSKKKRNRGKPARQKQNDPLTQGFQHILKNESYERAVKAIGAIQSELDIQLRIAGRNGRWPHNDNIPLHVSSESKQQLEDCVDLVEELFSKETATRFKGAVTRLAEIDQSEKLGQSTRYATAAIGTLRSELAPVSLPVSEQTLETPNQPLRQLA
ncbi:MAG: hypothetical protein RIC14_08775 [Filomicrobium sp.]